MSRARIWLPHGMDNYETAIEYVRGRFTALGGGFTEYEATGGYVMDNGDLEREPVTIVETYTGRDDIREAIKGTARHVGTGSGEETIMAAVDGEKIMV